MKIHLVNVSDVDESMRMQLRMWRNSDAVSPFFLLDQVTEDQHQAWLERNIRGEDAIACVIYADQVPLGLVYLPWVATELELERLYARILENNAASIRFHERMGFSHAPEEDGECEKNGERKRVLMYVKTL